MSLSITFLADDGNDGPFQLSSATGWNLVSEWADSLPEGYASIKVLTDSAECGDTRELGRQLTEALEKFPPDNPDVKDTLEELLDLMGVGDPAEVAMVTE